MLMELSSMKKKIADFQKAAASVKGKKMGPRDNTLIWLIRRHNAEDTVMGHVWIPSARTISTWTTDMVPLDKTSSPCQQ
ncbi:hypothetical protein LEMLEM_LOCUS2101 [Lemmus lemmus]